jgi:TonB family protein
MITSWLLFAMITGLLLTVAASALERIARTVRMPSRFLWLAAAGATVAWPLVAAVAGTRSAAVGSPRASVLPFPVDVDRVAQLTVTSIGQHWADRLDAILLVAWGVVSAALILRLAVDLARLRRMRAGWRRLHVDGLLVRVSESSGPAVVGTRDMDVVLPEWMLSFEPALRALIVRHEQEHRAARDPVLLLGAQIMTALVPWHAPLRWQTQRLRLAIEVDCDARVLRAHPDRQRYARLLLAIAQRSSVGDTLNAVALVEPLSYLERRIVAMQSPTPRFQRLRIAAGCVVAVAALAVACSVEKPLGEGTRVARSEHDSSMGGLRFNFAVDRPATAIPGQPQPVYPNALRSVRMQGTVEIQVVIDTTGRADMSTFKVLSSPHDLFSNSVQTALRTYRYLPATVNGRKVKVWLQQAFSFKIGS